MATFDEIYDFETALEENLRASFVALGFNAYTRKNSVEEFQKFRPRLSIAVQIGGANGHSAMLTESGNSLRGEQRSDQFGCTVILMLVTTPSNVEGDNVLMPAFRARVRSFMAIMDRRSRQDTTNFPIHCFGRLIEGGTEYLGIDSENALELGTLNYTGTFAVRPEAWPTS